MFDLRIATLSVFVSICLIPGCRKAGTTEYPTEDTLTPGIFLERAERATLPEGVELRRVYEKGIQVTKASEGFRSYLYNDAAGYCTIGFGHLIFRKPCDGSAPPRFQRGVTEEQATDLLVQDMEIAEVAVMLMTTVNLTDGQYAALCDFAFNVGSRNLRTSTLLKAVNSKQFDRVPGQFSRWVWAGNPAKEIPGLKRRREREIELFFDGIARPRAGPPEGEDLSPIDIRRGEYATTAVQDKPRTE